MADSPNSNRNQLHMVHFSDFIESEPPGRIPVVFEDEYYIAVFKPAGLMVHRGPKTLATEPVLLQILRDQIGQFVYPVHRLDRPTAGLIIFGKSTAAAAKLGTAFSSRYVTKHYQSLVRGFMPDELTVDRPLAPQSDHDLDLESQDTVAAVPQEAVTHFKTLRRFEAPWPSSGFNSARFSLLEVRPHTGRWHQIRRHLNHLAHPIIGDHRHGDHRWNQMFHSRTRVYRMLLTSMRLDFRHPFTQSPISLLVGRGEAFDSALGQLKEFEVVDLPASNACIPSRIASI